MRGEHAPTGCCLGADDRRQAGHSLSGNADARPESCLQRARASFGGSRIQKLALFHRIRSSVGAGGDMGRVLDIVVTSLAMDLSCTPDRM